MSMMMTSFIHHTSDVNDDEQFRLLWLLVDLHGGVGDGLHLCTLQSRNTNPGSDEYEHVRTPPHTHTHTHKRTHMYTVYTHTHTHTHTHHTHMTLASRTPAHSSVYHNTHERTQAHTHTHIRARTHTCTHIHTHTHTHTRHQPAGVCPCPTPHRTCEQNLCVTPMLHEPHSVLVSVRDWATAQPAKRFEEPGSLVAFVQSRQSRYFASFCNKRDNSRRTKTHASVLILKFSLSNSKIRIF